MSRESFDPKIVHTSDLRSSDVPVPQREWLPSEGDRDDWSSINFALSFDGYAFLGDDAGQFCNAVHDAYERTPAVLEMFNTTGLRMLLFFEQRRAKWNEEVYVDDYPNAIVRRIAERLT